VRFKKTDLITAALLTALDGVVMTYDGPAIWSARSGDVLARGLLILFAALGAISLANVWARAMSGWYVSSKCRSREGLNLTPSFPGDGGGQRGV
jgi:hypothetical protein